MAKADCQDCPWSETGDLLEVSDEAESHERKEMHDVDVKRAAADGGNDICAACQTPISSEDPPTNALGQPIHFECGGQIRCDGGESYILDLSDEYPADTCIEIEFGCSHRAFGPATKLPEGCPECDTATDGGHGPAVQVDATTAAPEPDPGRGRSWTCAGCGESIVGRPDVIDRDSWQAYCSHECFLQDHGCSPALSGGGNQ